MKHHKGAGTGSGGALGTTSINRHMGLPMGTLFPSWKRRMGTICPVCFNLPVHSPTVPGTASPHTQPSRSPPHPHTTTRDTASASQSILPANPSCGCSRSPYFGTRWCQAPLQIPLPALLPSRWLPGYWLVASVCLQKIPLPIPTGDGCLPMGHLYIYIIFF